MNSRTESTTFETVAESVRPPQGDGWDYLVIAGIFASMFALAWAALATPLLQPLVDVARRQHWTMLWVRPTVIWITMGMLLLLLRTVLWLLYRPFAAVRRGTPRPPPPSFPPPTKAPWSSPPSPPAPRPIIPPA